MSLSTTVGRNPEPSVARRADDPLGPLQIWGSPMTSLRGLASRPGRDMKRVETPHRARVD